MKKKMTVGELVEKLKLLPQDVEIRFNYGDEAHFFIDSVSVERDDETDEQYVLLK